MLTRIAVALLLAFAAGCSGDPKVEEDTPPEAPTTKAESGHPLSPWLAEFVPPRVTFEQLRETVSPYGNWIEVPVYGEVWKPDPGVVGEGWVPYTRGHWVYTRCGWSWVSEFKKWGWAPFHFGRFAHTPLAGWVWIPGTVWAPAHVAWREGEGLIGWAAVPPGYSVSEVVMLGNSARVPREGWVFVEKKYFASPDLPRYLLADDDDHLLLRYTRRITSWVQLSGSKECFFVGPHREALSEEIRQDIPIVTFAQIAETYSTRALPLDAAFSEGKFVPGPENSEVKPDTDWSVTVAGPGSPRKLPPRRLSAYYSTGTNAPIIPPQQPGSPQPPPAQPQPQPQPQPVPQPARD